MGGLHGYACGSGGKSQDVADLDGGHGWNQESATDDGGGNFFDVAAMVAGWKVSGIPFDARWLQGAGLAAANGGGRSVPLDEL